MRESLIVMRRELRSYFLSPIAYVFGVLFLGVLGFLACSEILVHGMQAHMVRFFGLLPSVFIIFLPAFTMRLWAEERKQGTLELLLTFPVRLSHLIFGKFLAALTYVAILLLLTSPLPITMEWFGNLDWGPVLITYLACILMAAAYVSVGMFWSSITRDQIIAFLITVVTLGALFLLGMFVGEIRSIIPAKWEWFRETVVLAVTGISPYGYFNSIARGVLDTGDLIYYVCFTAFFLHANWLVLHGRRVRG